MTRTVHLVYPSGPAVSCPDAIGRNLAARLRARYEVRQYDWKVIGRIRPGADDVLVGHPHPVPFTVFRSSSALPGWKRVIGLAPFLPDPRYVGFHGAVLAHCDVFLAITGAHWYRSSATSIVGHWGPKLVHVDLAIDRADFPRVKPAFSPPGRRRFVYIGNTLGCKNVDYLSQIAERMRGVEFAWIGRGTRPISGLRALGFQDFGTEEARRRVAEYDFMVTVGRADANPATILEAMAWGLVPVCTPQSGYDHLPGVANVPLDDADGAAAVLRRLLDAPASELERMRACNDAALDRHFTWDRFTAQVVEAIESGRSPRLLRAPWRRRARIFSDALLGPASPARPSILWPVAAATARRWLAEGAPRPGASR